jgi:hypothetical protein
MLLASGRSPTPGRPVIARLKQLPADLRREVHRRRALAEERAGFRRAGERLAATEEVPSGSPSLREEVRRATAELDGLAAERLVVGEAELRDLARVGWWVRPAVIARTVSSRVVLQHDRRRAQRALDAAHEALGRAAALGGVGVPGPGVAQSREVAFAWNEHAAREVRGFNGAVWEQLRSHLLPKAPALVGMAVGWWIADTYTDSHIRSALRTIGIGSGGTHVVSGSTYRAMTFWLPLLAAAVCAYAGERLWQRVVGREEQRA